MPSPFKPFAVVVKNHYEPTYALRLVIDKQDITIGKLKTLIEEQHKGNPQIQDQLLVYRGKLLESKTNLFTLFTSSIIKPSTPITKNDSDSNDNTTTQQDDAPLESMYIHMTLRGGSDTATKIGLLAKKTLPSDPILFHHLPSQPIPIPITYPHQIHKIILLQTKKKKNMEMEPIQEL